MNKVLTAALGIAAIGLMPSAAHAQDEATAGTGAFVGLSAGYHDLGVSDDLDALAPGLDVSDSSPIFGVVAGFDFPLGNAAFAGVEGNLHMGSDAIDYEYGAAARLGIRTESGSKFYVRGGYQEVDIDVSKAVGGVIPPALLAGVDDTDGDYLVGVGTDIPLGNSALRFNVDTISFDTVRATAGFVFGF